MIVCSTEIMVGAIVGATLGALSAFAHPSYPDQVVVSLATIGANLGAYRLSLDPPCLAWAGTRGDASAASRAG